MSPTMREVTEVQVRELVTTRLGSVAVPWLSSTVSVANWLLPVGMGGGEEMRAGWPAPLKSPTSEADTAPMGRVLAMGKSGDWLCAVAGRRTMRRRRVKDSVLCRSFNQEIADIRGAFHRNCKWTRGASLGT